MLNPKILAIKVLKVRKTESTSVEKFKKPVVRKAPPSRVEDRGSSSPRRSLKVCNRLVRPNSPGDQNAAQQATQQLGQTYQQGSQSGAIQEADKNVVKAVEQKLGIGQDQGEGGEQGGGPQQAGGGQQGGGGPQEAGGPQQGNEAGNKGEGGDKKGDDKVCDKVKDPLDKVLGKDKCEKCNKEKKVDKKIRLTNPISLRRRKRPVRLPPPKGPLSRKTSPEYPAADAKPTEKVAGAKKTDAPKAVDKPAASKPTADRR